MRGCSVPGCERIHYAHGLCRVHYIAVRRLDPTRPPCSVDGCGRPAFSRGLCNNHYEVQRRTGQIEVVAMGGRCRVCTHPEREAIEAVLRSGGSAASAARRWDLTAGSVKSHRARHLDNPAHAAKEAAEAVARLAVVRSILGF